MRGSSGRYVAMAVLVGVLGGLGLAGAFLVGAFDTSRQDDRYGLDCGTIGVITTEGGRFAARTPDDAIRETGWLDALDVPQEARTIVAGEGSGIPENGIVPIEPDADGVVTEAERRAGQQYLGYVDGKAILAITIAQDQRGMFGIAGLTTC